MNKPLKIRKVGDDAVVILPKALLARLGVTVGDTLIASLTPDGIRLTVADSDYPAEMAAAEEIMREDRDVLRGPAK